MSWTGLDYELGSNPVIPEYWEEIDKGVSYNILKEKLRCNNPIWNILSSEFKME